MLDLTVIILTFNEEIHIKRALENVCPIAKEVLVVDCFSTDNTVAICKEFENVRVITHAWPGNQAEQFNWALDNGNIVTTWAFRLDADEYLTTELIDEMVTKIPSLQDNVSAVVLPLGRGFMGRQLKYGGVNGVKMIRLFRFGKARYEVRLMDEHLQITSGDIISFKNKFIDDSLISLSQFVEKHNGYANREMLTLLKEKYNVETPANSNANYAEEVVNKRSKKSRYSQLPLFWRSLGYFLYRYIFKLGFLDGKEGFIRLFFQTLFYRMLVDSKIYEMEKKCGNNPDIIKEKISKLL